MTDILHRLAAGASGDDIFMSSPPHLLAALIDEGLAVVDMARGHPEMALTAKGKEAVEEDDRITKKGRMTP